MVAMSTLASYRMWMMFLPPCMILGACGQNRKKPCFSTLETNGGGKAIALFL